MREKHFDCFVRFKVRLIPVAPAFLSFSFKLETVLCTSFLGFVFRFS